MRLYNKECFKYGKLINALIVSFALFAMACNKEEAEVYDHPFVHIAYEGASSTTVSSKATILREYNVYLSSKPLDKSLVVEYELIVGDGLTQGEDFDVITTGTALTFLPGIYKMPIRIRWTPQALDEDKDNTVIIRLVGNNMGMTLGLPGPDNREMELRITKTL